MLDNSMAELNNNFIVKAQTLPQINANAPSSGQPVQQLGYAFAVTCICELPITMTTLNQVKETGVA